MSKQIKCEFTSDWSDGTSITTPCIYDPKTGEVTPESSNTDPSGSLEREHITLPDGDEKDVCTTCHEYVMKSVMNPGTTKHDLVEEQVCSNPDCESNQ